MMIDLYLLVLCWKSKDANDKEVTMVATDTHRMAVKLNPSMNLPHPYARHLQQRLWQKYLVYCQPIILLLLNHLEPHHNRIHVRIHLHYFPFNRRHVPRIRKGNSCSPGLQCRCRPQGPLPVLLIVYPC